MVMLLEVFKQALPMGMNFRPSTGHHKPKRLMASFK